MECPACSKNIPDESAFCLYCGEKISPPAQTTDSLADWEYKEVFLPNSAFSPRLIIVLQNKREADPADLEQLWSTYRPQIPGILQNETAQGWSPVPDSLEADCLVYEMGSHAFKDYSRADWIWLAILSIFSVGVYLLFAPLVNSSTGVIQPQGVNVKLRRKKQ